MSEKTTDSKGHPLNVGTRVHCGAPGSHDPEDYAIVVAISDVDGDVDDEGRAVAMNPRVHVKFADGKTADFGTVSTATGPWDTSDAPYECGNVSVVVRH